MLGSLPSRAHDVGRSTLERLLERTEDLGAFPLKSRYLATHAEDAEVLNRLIGHRGSRYLFETPASEYSGSRLALTVAGTFALDSDLGRREQEGLRELFDILAFQSTGSFTRKTVSVEWLHTGCPWSHRGNLRCSAPTLARRLTQLSSPRLSGQMLDPGGYCGESSACGVVDPATGYFTSVALARSFGVGRSFEVITECPLLPATRLLAVRESSGLIHIEDGPTRLVTLPNSHGPRTLAVLLDHPNRLIHCLDMQAAIVDLAPLPCADDDDLRLAALWRRVQLLKSLSDNPAKRPGWAKQLKAEDLRADVEAGLSLGDLSVIDNAQRVLCRALRQTLKAEELRSLRRRITTGECLLFR